MDACGNYKPFFEYPVQAPTTPAGPGVVHFCAVNPAGVIIADPGAIAYDPNGGVYVKTGPGWNAIGWEARMSPVS